MTNDHITLQRGGAELVPQARELWNLLFDHHLATGAAGLAVIPRDRSWPLREAHYAALLAAQPRVSIWLASRDGIALGYALSFVCDFEGQPAVVLETLSVDPAARGIGVGSLLMDAVDREASAENIEVGVVDVMAGNPRARALYLRRDYKPYSETWMRSEPAAAAGLSSDCRQLPRLVASAAALDLQLEVSSGPDDTWVSADVIVDLSITGDALTRETLDAGDDPRREQLDNLLAGLFGAGFWTIRFELPTEPSAAWRRAQLLERGYRLSTERLVRREGAAAHHTSRACGA